MAWSHPNTPKKKTTTKKPTKKQQDLAAQLRDPNKRSKIPTAQLPPKYRAARLARLRAEKLNNNPLYQPQANLQGQSLRDAVTQSVRSETQPQIDALTRQGQAITTEGNRQVANLSSQGGALSSRTSDIYAQIAREAAEGVARQSAITQRVRGELGTIDQGNQAAVAQAGQEALKVLTPADTAGLAGSGVERLASEGQALSGRAAAQGAAYRSSNETLGAANAGLQNNLGSAAALRGGEVQERLAILLANRMADAQARTQGAALENQGALQSAQANVGPLTAKRALDLRQQSFENQVVDKQFGLSTAKAEADATNDAARIAAQERAAKIASRDRKARIAQDAKDKAAQRRLEAKKVRTATEQRTLDRISRERSQRAAQIAQDRRQERQIASRPAKGMAGLTPIQIQAARERSAKQWSRVEDALELVHTNRVNPDTKKPPTTQETIAALQGQKTPAWVIQAMLSIRHNGFIDAKTEALIRRSAPSVRIPSKYRRPKRGAGGGTAVAGGGV